MYFRQNWVIACTCIFFSHKANKRHLSRENSGRWCLLLHGYQTGVKRLSISNAKRKHINFLNLVRKSSNKLGLCTGLAIKEIDTVYLSHATRLHYMGIISMKVVLCDKMHRSSVVFSSQRADNAEHKIFELWAKWNAMTLIWRRCIVPGELQLSVAPFHYVNSYSQDQIHWEA